jgi:hypothetical protein
MFPDVTLKSFINLLSSFSTELPEAVQRTAFQALAQHSGLSSLALSEKLLGDAVLAKIQLQERLSQLETQKQAALLALEQQLTQLEQEGAECSHLHQQQRYDLTSKLELFDTFLDSFSESESSSISPLRRTRILSLR